MSNLYKLTKAMPGFPAGTIFEHREYDDERDLGSPNGGYLTNIWVDGNCQRATDGHIGWCAETHILPGQLKDSGWFKKVSEAKVSTAVCHCGCCHCGGVYHERYS